MTLVLRQLLSADVCVGFTYLVYSPLKAHVGLLKWGLVERSIKHLRFESKYSNMFFFYICLQTRP